uniref:Putative secreted protein n=1 Tax=Ixodes ricinus TaxID=34613 RepID=A0A147BKS7_IXORI
MRKSVKVVFALTVSCSVLSIGTDRSGDAGELVHETIGNGAQITEKEGVDGTSAELPTDYLIKGERSKEIIHVTIMSKHASKRLPHSCVNKPKFD